MENELKTWGKQMPYRVPDDFFARNREAIFAVTTRRNEQQKGVEQALKRRLWGRWSWAAAACVACVALVGLWRNQSAPSDPTLYAYASTMGDDEVALWVDFYEADLFLSAALNEE